MKFEQLKTNSWKHFYFLLIAFLVSSTLFAQSISYPTSAQPITRGLDSTLLTVKIDFPSACTGVNITVNLGATNAPGIVEYIPNSFILTAGTATVTENASNLQSPVFSIPSVTLGQFITFTIKRRANCGSAAGSRDNIVVTGTGCSFSDINPATNTYDLNAPALTVSPPAPLTNAALGAAYNRTFSIIDGGNGCLDTMGLWIVYPPSSIQLNSLKIGATTLTPTFTNGDSSYYIIYGAILGPGNKLCNAQSVVFTENITILKCGPVTTYGASWFEYSGTACQSATGTAGISMANTFPTLTVTNTVAALNSCYIDAPRAAGATITNTGTGAAKNIVFNTGNTYINLPRVDNYGYIDTASLIITPSIGAPFHPTPAMYTAYFYAVSSTYYSPSCNWGKITNVELTMPASLTINPGASLTISYNMIYCDAPSACGLAWEAIYLSTVVKYKNECGNQNYLVNGVEDTDRPYNRAGITAFQYPAQIIAGDCFSVTVSTNEYVTNGFGKSYVDYKIKLPSGCSFSSANIIGVVATPHPGYPKVIGDTAIVRYSVASAGNPVRFNICSTPASCGTQSISANIVSSPDSTCTKNNKSTACQTNPINFVCPSPCPTGGIVPVFWKFKRTNFGLPDNNFDKLPDASGTINPLTVDVDRYRAGDTMHSEYRSYVIPQTQDRAGNPNSIPNWNQVNANWNFSRHIWVPAGSATVTIKRLGVTTVVPAVPITTVTYGKNYTADFSTGPIALTSLAPFLPNDSVIVEADFKLLDSLYKQANTSFYTILDDGVSGIRLAESPDVVLLTHNVYASTMPNPVPVNQFTCFTPLYNANVLSLSHFTYIYGANFVGCNTARPIIYSYTRTLGGYSANYYTGEYRPSFIPDTATISYPAGLTVIPGSQNIGGIYGGLTNAATGSYITITGTHATGQKVTMDFKNAFAANPTWLIASEGTYWYFSMEVKTGCATSSTFYTPISEIGHIYHWPSNTNEARYEVNEITLPGSTVNLASTYDVSTKPNINIASPNALVAPISDTAKWSVNLLNSTIQPVPVNFLKITPTTGFNNYTVKIGGVTQTPNGDGLYLLGSIGAGGSITNLTIEANTNNCSLDSFKIQTGWDCSTVPTGADLAAYSCWKDFWLKATPQLSQIQLNVLKQPVVLPATSIPLCSTTTAEFVINSALANYADNPLFIVTPPMGLTISMGEIEYPLGSGNWQTITPTIAGGLYTYSIENHTALSAGGLPGTLTFSTAPQRSAKLRITFATNCDFVSGSKIAVQQRGDRPCGQQIPSNLGYNNIVRTDPIYISGVSTSGSGAFTLSSTPNTVTCGPSVIGGSITPIGTTTQIGDTVVVTIPYGLIYQAASFTSASGITLSTGSPIAGAGGSQILKLVLPIGISGGTAINYQFGVLPTTTINNCGDYTVASEFVRTLPPISCGGSSCPNNTKVVMGVDDKIITVNKPDLEITNMTVVSGYYAAGSTFISGVTISNTGTAATTGPTIIEYFCGNSTTPFATYNFNQIIAAGASATENITVTVPGPSTCVGGDLVKGVVRPNAAGGQCVCDSASFILNGTALPVRIVSFEAIAQKINVKTTWAVADELNVSTYEVEHSTDGNIFKKVGNVNATGNSSYNFVHKSPSYGVNYYRLRIVDANGTFKYSETRKVNFVGDGEPQVNPNPAKNVLNINLPFSWTGKKVSIKIYSIEGKLVLNKEIINATDLINLDVSSLPPSQYYLKILSNEKTISKKISIVK